MQPLANEKTPSVQMQAPSFVKNECPDDSLDNNKFFEEAYNGSIVNPLMEVADDVAGAPSGKVIASLLYFQTLMNIH